MTCKEEINMADSKPKFAIVFVLFFITVVFNAKSILKPNLNLVCREDLRTVQGIGYKKADLIIKEREKGYYTSFLDLDRRNNTIGKVLTPRLAENFTIKEIKE